ncbi:MULTISPECIES: hypothetical protein [Chryseobacterium]|uniref:Uncharacterized protein n=1 Tax=Chryseobacterium taihuense TaxID=1141221 RepID=A0A4U8WCK6_9FLAO|nr:MULTISPECIES: hypothetical protein [Chryseobacterium]QQV03407.1 hypothetical protein I6I61_03405 [Chryseobacterium sp. FDAARGOS 1104]VFB03276.1 Uncharacterised protein [Chryseobacterium taihuense]
MIQLFNVIEIDPFRYSKEEYEIPELSSSPTSKENNERWRKAISTLDLNLKPIQEGSYFVDIETIDDENLKIILKVIFENVEIDGTDFLSSFNGGLILMKNDDVLIEPTCCSDLENLKNWQYIFENDSAEWSELWIGHPWIFYKKENGKIQFSDYTEDMLSELESIQFVFEVDEVDLQIEINKMKERQIHFNNRVIKLLTEI